MRPNYENILKEKTDYYGETKAAYQFCAEEYARQYHTWMESWKSNVSAQVPLDFVKWYSGMDKHTFRKQIEN